MPVLKGLLNAYWETGSEGVHWAFNEPTLPGYDALFILKNGNEIKVIDDDNKDLWHGILDLEYKSHYTEYPLNPGHGQQSINGFWIHGLQKDVDAEKWAKMFFDSKRAYVDFNDDQVRPHIFRGDLLELDARIDKLEDKDAQELFRSSLYGWLSFYCDGEFFSIGQELGLNYNEILEVLENPTDEQIQAHKTYPKTSRDSLLPYSKEMLIRLGMLWRIYGLLRFKFTTIDQRLSWLETPNAGLLNRVPKDLICEKGLEGVSLLQQMLTFEN